MLEFTQDQTILIIDWLEIQCLLNGEIVPNSKMIQTHMNSENGLGSLISTHE